MVRSIERLATGRAGTGRPAPMFVGAYAREGSNAEFRWPLRTMRQPESRHRAAGAHLPREPQLVLPRFDDQRGWHSGYNRTDELVATAQVSVPAGSRGKLLVPVKCSRYRVEVLNPETKLVTRFPLLRRWSARDDQKPRACAGPWR